MSSENGGALGKRKIERKLPKWSEFAPLLGFKKPELDPVERRLQRALTVKDLAEAARRRTPKSVFYYVHGAAEAELSIWRARDAFSRVEFEPRVLHDVGGVSTSTTILGREASFPLILAPTGFTRMMQHEGEIAVARSAARAGVPYTLSTMGTTSPGDLQRAVPSGDNWFQLYLWKDRDATRQLIEQVRAAGYDTLVLTVDDPRCRQPPARHPQRPDDPAVTEHEDLHRLRDVPELVGEHPHHRADRVREPEVVRRHGRRARRPDVRPEPEPRRPAVAARRVGGLARREGHPVGRRREARGGSRRGRDRRVEPRRPPSSTARQRRSNCCRRSPRQ